MRQMESTLIHLVKTTDCWHYPTNSVMELLW